MKRILVAFLLGLITMNSYAFNIHIVGEYANKVLNKFFPDKKVMSDVVDVYNEELEKNNGTLSVESVAKISDAAGWDREKDKDIRAEFRKELVASPQYYEVCDDDKNKTGAGKQDKSSEKDRKCADKISIQTKRIDSVTQTDSNHAQTEIQSTQAKIDNTIDTSQEFESEETCKKLLYMRQHGKECYQDSAGKWKIRWTVKEGDPCPVEYCSVHKAVTACKYDQIEEKSFHCAVTACADGYKVIDGMCKKEQTVTCDETKGLYVNAHGDDCWECPNGHIVNNGKCEKCPEDKKPAGNKCIDYTCGASEYKLWGKCETCYNKNSIVKDNKCVACPDTQKAQNNQCVDFTCPSGKYKSSGECVACNKLYANMVPNADQSSCEPNKTPEVLNAFKQACLTNGGNLTTPTKCVFSTGRFQDIGTKCGNISQKVKLPTFTNSDDGGKTTNCTI